MCHFIYNIQKKDNDPLKTILHSLSVFSPGYHTDYTMNYTYMRAENTKNWGTRMQIGR